MNSFNFTGDSSMSWFSRKKAAPERTAWREQFQSTMQTIRGGDRATQAVIGHSINMGNSLLHKRFGSFSAFRALPKREKLDYFDSLSKIKDSLSNTDPVAALGRRS